MRWVLEVIYFLQAGCGKIRGLSIELLPGEFFPVAIVLCRAGACKRAILLCGKAVNPARFVRRNTLRAANWRGTRIVSTTPPYKAESLNWPDFTVMLPWRNVPG
jgi:hypothetical protein